MASNESPMNFYQVLLKLPASLIFILLVDYILFRNLIPLYKEQINTGDVYRIYTLIVILSTVAVNLIVLLIFAISRSLEQKPKKRTSKKKLAPAIETQVAAKQ